MTSFLIGALFLYTAAAEPEPAAMVLKARGAVTRQTATGPANRPAPMSLLFPGDRLHLKVDGEAVVVFLDDGHKEVLKPDTDVTVAPEGCQPAASVERQELPEGQKQAILEGLGHLGRSGRSASVTMRSVAPPSNALAGAHPMPNAAVLEVRPTFAWAPVAGAEGYEVRLYDVNRRVIWKETTAEARLPYPTKQPALARGDVHHWEVTAQMGEKAAVAVGESSFAVLSEPEARELEPLAALAKSTDPADLLLAAATYHAYGLHDRALELYERLCKLDAHAAAFHAARAAYYEQAGRRDEARKALQEVKKLGSPPAQENEPPAKNP